MKLGKSSLQIFYIFEACVIFLYLSPQSGVCRFYQVGNLKKKNLQTSVTRRKELLRLVSQHAHILAGVSNLQLMGHVHPNTAVVHL